MCAYTFIERIEEDVCGNKAMQEFYYWTMPVRRRQSNEMLEGQLLISLYVLGLIVVSER